MSRKLLSHIRFLDVLLVMPHLSIIISNFVVLLDTIMVIEKVGQMMSGPKITMCHCLLL